MPSKLEVGDAAPNFKLPSDAGNDVSLGDFKGKTLVLYFYPKDNTPGCTREAQAFSAMASKLQKRGAAVVGVSKDSVKSHCGFRDKYALKFPLLSDPELGVHKAYGTYGEKMMYGKKILGTIRTTFVIDGKGKIARVFPSVKVDGHAEAVLEAVDAIAKPKKG
jgi:peroxiredoxin Q/BCP